MPLSRPFRIVGHTVVLSLGSRISTRGYVSFSLVTLDRIPEEGDTIRGEDLPDDVFRLSGVHTVSEVRRDSSGRVVVVLDPFGGDT